MRASAVSEVILLFIGSSSQVPRSVQRDLSTQFAHTFISLAVDDYLLYLQLKAQLCPYGRPITCKDLPDGFSNRVSDPIGVLDRQCVTSSWRSPARAESCDHPISEEPVNLSFLEIG